MNKTIKIKYFPGANKLEKIDKGDWIDLSANENIDMKAGEFIYIPLGVAMKLPTGYEAYIIPRSSTYKRYKILMANDVGLVDASYCGDSDQWMFPALAVEDTHIDKGTRIAQFRIQENQPKIIFEEVENLDDNSRGGLGSTGI